ncbi:polysaccharide deacetylase family protein [Pontibacter ruber]|uniref:Polysaccharide deacetylase family protein n=1 Tax=Pontibacter ruber TaxID=1343895 RepID=A0ABW5D0X4_9BACT|nr:polysaccharide deacetylase family protein [Pontibacter ruber]
MAIPDVDIWDMAVSPENFEQQLQVLKAGYRVLPLKELAERVRRKKLRCNTVAITFDDGYADNYVVAKPLLEKYNLPATFFVTSGNIGTEAEFWWDELEQLFLFTDELPQTISIKIAGTLVEANLGQESILNKELHSLHRQWKAIDEPPVSVRSRLFLQVWQLLKELPPQKQQHQLQTIREWVGTPQSIRSDYRSMSVEQLQELAKNSLFEIGAHTVSHVALGYHPASYQKQELMENRSYLEKKTNRSAATLSYPYGNYNSETMALAADLGFLAAFTTEEKIITNHSSAYQMGRFQVKNLAAPAFESRLKYWSLYC